MSSIRDDLISFEPIEILPITDATRNSVRKIHVFPFVRLTANFPFVRSIADYLVPFNLSAKPPRAWRKIFSTKWKQANQRASVRLKERELSLVFKPESLGAIFPYLKQAVAHANVEHKSLLEKAQKKIESKRQRATDEANAKREKELSVRFLINSTLDKFK